MAAFWRRIVNKSDVLPPQLWQVVLASILTVFSGKCRVGEAIARPVLSIVFNPRPQIDRLRLLRSKTNDEKLIGVSPQGLCQSSDRGWWRSTEK